MTPIEDHELAAYVLGDAPPELRTRIEAASAADEDFAAELAALSSLGCPGEAGTLANPLTAAQPAARRRRSMLHRAALAAGVLLAVGGVAWGGYELLRTPPLLEDDFSSRTIANKKWHPYLGRKGVSATDGYLRLLNRGSVVTRAEFEGPIEITLDWRWVDHGQWPLYAEVFTVCLRTNGHHKPEHAYEIQDGLLLCFNTLEGRVRADRPGVVELAMIAGAPPDSTPMPAGVWHHLRIVDDGQAVSVYLEGPSVDPKYKKEPVLTVAIPEGLTGKHVALFNREYVAGTNHESHVDNVRIRAIRK